MNNLDCGLGSTAPPASQLGTAHGGQGNSGSANNMSMWTYVGTTLGFLGESKNTGNPGGTSTASNSGEYHSGNITEALKMRSSNLARIENKVGHMYQTGSYPEFRDIVEKGMGWWDNHYIFNLEFEKKNQPYQNPSTVRQCHRIRNKKNQIRIQTNPWHNKKNQQEPKLMVILFNSDNTNKIYSARHLHLRTTNNY